MNDDNNELRDFTPPELSDDFYQRLDARIADEPTRVATTTPFVRRHWRSFGTTAIAAAATVALISTAVLSDSSTNRRQSPPDDFARPTTTDVVPSTIPPEEPFDPTLASQVIARANTQYGLVQGIQGTSTVTQYCVQDSFMSAPIDCSKQPHPLETVTQFRIRSNGDTWTNVLSDEAKNKQANFDNYYFVSQQGTIQAYDSTKNESTTASYIEPGKWERTQTLHYTKKSNSAGAEKQFLLFGHFTLQSLLDGLSFDQSPRLEAATFNDRPAWKIESKGRPLDMLGTSPDGVIAYFDRETLFPLKVTELREGQVMQESVISDLEIDPGFTSADFQVSIPKGAPVKTEDGQWKSVTLPNLPKSTSYRPLVTSWVPDGFKLLDTWFTKDLGPAGPEGLNPQNRDVVVFFYGRGLQQLTITTRLVGKGQEYPWLDPHGSEGRVNQTTTFNVQGGAYNGVEAKLETGFGTQPHVWVVGATLVTTVIGDVSAQELKQILGSMQRQ
jgi:hypothetical protein